MTAKRSKKEGKHESTKNSGSFGVTDRLTVGDRADLWGGPGDGFCISLCGPHEFWSLLVFGQVGLGDVSG
jgi:hypothetical protein